MRTTLTPFIVSLKCEQRELPFHTVAAGIAFNMVYTFWFYNLEVTWWQNMQTYFYDVNSSISTTQLSDKYALEWNQLIHYYQCCGIEVRYCFLLLFCQDIHCKACLQNGIRYELVDPYRLSSEQ